jgi:hypothetical protein
MKANAFDSLLSSIMGVRAERRERKEFTSAIAKMDAPSIHRGYAHLFKQDADEDQAANVFKTNDAYQVRMGGFRLW